MTTQMRGFGVAEPTYEQAIHAFSGGFMHRGDACGLLTGAVLAAGLEARRRFADDDTRSAAALHAAVRLAVGLPELAGSINCRDVTETELVTIGGRFKYFWTGVAPRCGRLHLKWGERAHQLIDRSLTEFAAREPAWSAADCATETMRRCAPAVGMPADDAVAVAGLAGGVALLGNVCGALGAGVFALGVRRYGRQREDTRDSRFRGTVHELVGAAYRGTATKLRRAFEAGFGSRLCEEVIGRRFESPASHSAFIEQGGCQEVIAAVGDWVVTTAGS